MQNKHTPNAGVYCNLKNDIAFKMVFGHEENKQLLLTFLRKAIRDRSISDIEFKNSEYIPREEGQKSSRYDIICTDDKGGVFIVELQCIQYDYFYDRIVIYASHELSKSLKRGEAYSEARPVYLICLIDYFINLKHDAKTSNSKVVRESHIYMDDNKTAPLTDKLNFIFLQLPAAKRIYKRSSWMHKFAFTIRNIGSLTKIPRALEGDEYFEKIYNRCKFVHMSTEERKQYDMLERDEQEIICVKSFARREGREEGREEGRMEGRKEGRMEGREEGRMEGREEGLMEGREEGRMETLSLMAVALGISIEEAKNMISNIIPEA